MAIHADPEVDVLIERWQRDGDERARDKIFAKYEAWFHWAAHKWGPRCNVDHDDAVQAARIGFARALDRYDPTLGYRITALAQHWAHQAISRFRVEQYAVRIPAHVLTDAATFRRALHDMKVKGIEITDEAICERLGWSRGQLEAVRTVRDHVSLDAPVGSSDDGEGFSLMNLIPADSGWRPDTAVDEQEDATRIRDAVDLAASGLNERNADIFRRRFVDEQTLEAIGQHYDLTRERVRQLLSEEIVPQVRKALTGDPRITDVIPDRVIEEERLREDAWFRRMPPKPAPVLGSTGPRPSY